MHQLVSASTDQVASDGGGAAISLGSAGSSC